MMTKMNAYPDDINFLLVPGLRDHVEDHWQTHLQKELLDAGQRCVTVPPLEHNKLSRAARVQALHDTYIHIPGRVIIIAHSAGVMTTVHWAQQYRREGHRVHAALLATPADVEEPMPAGYPTLAALQENGWTPIPQTPLPFTAVLAASRNDPLARHERAQHMAQSWGAQLVDLGEVGHLNPAAGYGRWAGVHALIGNMLDNQPMRRAAAADA